MTVVRPSGHFNPFKSDKWILVGRRSYDFECELNWTTKCETIYLFMPCESPFHLSKCNDWFYQNIKDGALFHVDFSVILCPDVTHLLAV